MGTRSEGKGRERFLSGRRMVRRGKWLEFGTADNVSNGDGHFTDYGRKGRSRVRWGRMGHGGHDGWGGWEEGGGEDGEDGEAC